MKTEERQGQAPYTIPTKVQRIGNPGKMTALYIEDYVYTFLKQLMLLKENEMLVDIYGYQVKNQKKNHIIIMAAKEQEITQEEYEQDKIMFPSLHKIGTIHMDINKHGFQNGVIQITLEGETRQNVNGFYVFYDKNEPMQNYLVAWHQKGNKEKEPSELTVKYAKKLQQNQFYHAKDQYWRQCITAVCASLFVILSVMAITVINNYQKMLSLQDHVSYIVECMADDHSQVENVLHQNADVLSRLFQDESEWQTDTEDTTMAGTVTNSEDVADEDMDKDSGDIVDKAAEADTEMNQTEDSATVDKDADATGMENSYKKNTDEENIAEEKEDGDKIDEKKVDEENVNGDNAETDNSEKENSEVAEVSDMNSYSVVSGDTLQSILYRQYGSLNKLEQVCQLNQITDPDAIRIGQKIYLP